MAPPQVLWFPLDVYGNLALFLGSSFFYPRPTRSPLPKLRPAFAVKPEVPL
jgi:hypothetical protein